MKSVFYTRTAAAVLAVLTTLLTACGAASDAAQTTGAPAAGESEAEAVSETTTEAPRNSLPDDLDFDGRRFMIYVDKDLPIVDYHAEESGDIVEDALYARNLAVEELLDCKLEFFDSPGVWEGENIFKGGVRSSVLAGDGANDLVAGYSIHIATLATEGILANLIRTAYLDFSQPWWSDSLIDNLSIRDRLYFASGDISTNTTGSMFSCLFNKSQLGRYGIESPYPLVYDGTWTLDKLFELASGVYEDVNGDGKKDRGDTYGLVSNNTSFDNLYFSCGMNMTERTSDGDVVVSADWGSEKTVTLIEKLCAFFNDGEYALWSDETEGSCLYNFENGYSAFALLGLKAASVNLRHAEFDYGVLPTPKWDEKQDGYHNAATYTCAMYCIPIDADADASSAVMEALASESYYTLSPAFFEIAMKVKYSSDEDTSKMYDMIKGTVMYDFGRVFSQSALDSIPGRFRGAVTGNDPNWMSTYQSTLTKYETLLAGLTEKLVSFDD